MIIYDFSLIFSACWHIVSKFVTNPEDVDSVRFYERVTDALINVSLAAGVNFTPEIIRICLDSRNAFRKQILPEYKGTRSSKSDAFYCVKVFCENRLKEDYGDSVIQYEGLEADDLVYLEALKLKGGCVIVSSDQDLYQVSGMGLFNQFEKPVKYYNYTQHKFVEPDPFFTLVEKLLRGCKGDNVPSPVNGRVYTKDIQYITEKVRKNLTRQGVFMLASTFYDVDYDLFNKVYDCVVYHNSIYNTYVYGEHTKS